MSSNGGYGLYLGLNSLSLLINKKIVILQLS